ALAGKLVSHGVGGLPSDLASLDRRLPGGVAKILLLGRGEGQAGSERRAEGHPQRRHQDRLLLGELLELAAALLDQVLRLLQSLLALLLALGIHAACLLLALGKQVARLLLAL